MLLQGLLFGSEAAGRSSLPLPSLLCTGGGFVVAITVPVPSLDLNRSGGATAIALSYAPWSASVHPRAGRGPATVGAPVTSSAAGAWTAWRVAIDCVRAPLTG